MTDFHVGDHVRAKLWPELGTGTILAVTTGAPNSFSIRSARVHWQTGQKSTHSFAALAHVDQLAGGL